MTTLLVTLILMGLLWAPSAHAAAIAIFSTGVDNAGFALPGGSIDPHYTVSGGGAGPDVYTYGTPADFVWSLNTAGSAWISPALSGFPGLGTFTYSTTFDLSGFSASTASIGGSLTADDGAKVYLNGVLILDHSYTGLNSPWNQDASFLATSGFLSGVNTLSFEVPNIGGPSGLHVFVSGTVDASAVPEPGSWALLGAGLACLRSLKRRH